MYSAVKVKGKKLYEYARKNISVEIEPRDIEIYSMNLLSFEDDEITFEVSCSKGTYIRVLCEEIAEKLGTVGHMKDLRRIRVGDFKIENAVKLDEKNIEQKIISLENIIL